MTIVDASAARRLRGTVNSSRNLLRVRADTSFSASRSTYMSVVRTPGERCSYYTNDRQMERTVEIACGLEVGVAQSPKRLERLRVPALHHVPSRGFRAEEDLQCDEECGYPGLSNHDINECMRLKRRGLRTLPSMSRQLRPRMPLGSGTF